MDQPVHDGMKSVIATMCFEETVPWAQIMLKTLLPNTEKSTILFCVGCNPSSMGETRRIHLDRDKISSGLRDRVDRGVNDMAKAAMFGILQEHYNTEELFYIDADCLVLKPVDEVFRYKGKILLAEETHRDYRSYLERLKSSDPWLTFNAGVMLLREDYFSWWRWCYEKTFDMGPDVEGQLIWNAVWHKNCSDAEILPRKFNQLHVRHGPRDAVVYHFAGMDSQFKTEVMESCLQVLV